jgi:Transglycosylase SLT domain
LSLIERRKEKMSDSNEQKKGIDGKNIALVLMTLGGVGGYLWLDHKLRLERAVNADQSTLLLQLAALQASGALSKVALERLAVPPIEALPNPLRALPAATGAPGRNATSFARLPRLELAPRTYDDVFAGRGRGIPAPYLRALALHESDMRPRLSDGPAWGLMQVIEVVREDFNRRERKNFTRSDLLDPAVNVTIAASSLALIAKSYAANHSSANMQTNWRNPQFVALLTFGWNAGWSERGGVGRVVSFLEQRGMDVNVNSVFDASKASGASPHLANPMKLAFAKQVTRQYFAELADEERVIEIEDPHTRESSDRPAVVVEAPSSPPMPHAGADESPGFVIEHSIPPYVPMSSYGVPDGIPDHSAGPINSPSQVEHEPAPPGVVLAPIEHPDAPGPVASPVIGPPVAAPPVMVPTPAIGAPAMLTPSGGSGPIDPYDVPPEHYGYPEDPYAYSYAQGVAPHA